MPLTQDGFLPVPDCCHACASENIRKAQLKNNRIAWVCDTCDALVICHTGTDNPVGFMAGQKIRDLRKEAHAALDVLWRERLMTRDMVYLWLSVKLNIPREETHISWLSEAQLRTLIIVATEYYNECGDKLKLRAKKKKANRKERYDRENAVERRKIIERKRSRRY